MYDNNSSDFINVQVRDNGTYILSKEKQEILITPRSNYEFISGKSKW